MRRSSRLVLAITLIAALNVPSIQAEPRNPGEPRFRTIIRIIRTWLAPVINEDQLIGPRP